MVFGAATIDADSFEVWQPLDTMVFQWFPMVANHWFNDGMVTIHRHGLTTAVYCVKEVVILGGLRPSAAGP